MTKAAPHSALQAAHDEAAPLVVWQADARADGRRRRVEVSRDAVVIERSVAGVPMRLALAPQAYRGVALGVVVEDGLPVFEIALVHADPDLGARLGLADREGEALAALRDWSARLALPAFVEAADGELSPLRAGAPRTQRRRIDLARRRRPRFLLRRKPGVAARLAVCFAGEREIVCYE